MNPIYKFAVAALVIASPLAYAQDAHHGAHAAHGAPAAAQADRQVDGEIKKVDKEAGRITIRHGALKNLGMAPMTMVFRASDAALVDKVKAGDKVKFTAERVDGALTVTEIDPAG